ncbi:Lrp/AsnC family transcriptional regulator [Alysiella crassa]|uniref:HTH-type transcriptional regulator lrpC n=1 Tax=Alysiella crassa TaxID=153491 RepID=A0A376BW25_9NEIS|nr:Lrp/AsnC family transcriptional regulator [Alysiella crassa]UOP06476.1 Lrp/AsnC family transcriptional regulator [Alysiella crassa]SSY81008.1 HTH-type transcriptional regulator lrpC [Alysiella crassa]
MKKFDDKISLAILQTLRQNSRISWQELGKTVHLSGQATAERVKQMQENGVIDGFTIRENRPRHFIGVMMKHTNFQAFEDWLRGKPNVESVDKTSGDICYHIVYATENMAELEQFLNELLQHGGYRLNSSIRRVK